MFIQHLSVHQMFTVHLFIFSSDVHLFIRCSSVYIWYVHLFMFDMFICLFDMSICSSDVHPFILCSSVHLIFISSFEVHLLVQCSSFVPTFTKYFLVSRSLGLNIYKTTRSQDLNPGLLGKCSKIKSIIFVEFSAKESPPHPTFAENNYFFPTFFPNFFRLKMIFMLWNGFCMIWEIHLSIFWHLH